MKRLSPIEVWLLILIVMAGLGFRLYDLGGKSLWYDEIYIFHGANKDIGYIGKFLSQENTREFISPLNLLISYLSLSVSPNEFFLRLPSAVWGTLGILGIYFLGKIFWGPKEGLLGAFLLSISSFHVRYSQEGRMYALWVMVFLLANYFFWKALRENKNRQWFGFLAWTIVSLYTHLFAIFPLISQALYFGLGSLRNVFSGVVEQWEKKRKIFLLCFLIAAAVSAPRFIKSSREVIFSSKPWVVAKVTSVSGPAWRTRVTPVPILLSLYGAGRGWPLVLYAGFLILGVLGSLKRNRPALIYLLLIIGLPFLVFLFIKPSRIFSPRYLIYLMPIYYLLIARGVTCLGSGIGTLEKDRPRLQRYGRAIFYSITVAGFLLAGIGPLRLYYLENRDPEGRFFKFDWRKAAAFLEANVEAGDLVVTRGPMAYYDRICLEHYLSFELRGKLTDIELENMAGCGIWRLGRNYGPRNASSDAREEFVPSPVPGFAISRALHPVDLKFMGTVADKTRPVKVSVQPGKIFRFSVLVKEAENHYEGFSPCVPINFYDSTSQLVQVSDRAITWVADRKDGWKYYLLGGITPPTAEYATVSFHKRRTHIGDEFELADGKFYGDWE